MTDAPPDPAGARPDAWDRIVDRMERKRQQAREYRRRPEVKARQREYHRRYAAEHRDQLRAYNRDWMADYRRLGPKDGRVGALHSVMCDGQHWRPRAKCRPIPMFSYPQPPARGVDKSLDGNPRRANVAA